MKPITGLKLAKLAACVTLVGISGSALSTSQQEFAERVDTHVIIILRDQTAGVPASHDGLQARAAALSASQSALLSELSQSNSTAVHGFQTINALSATVSKSEVTRLSAHPLVKAVLPDAIIKSVKRVSLATTGARVVAGSAAATASSSSSGNAALCNQLEPQALQLTNTAFLDPTVPQAQLVRDGNGRYVTGEGVKVAFIADGVDTTVKGFTRSDGTPVFFDYENFDGDPAGTPTAGGEAFGDSSSIAAQDTPNGKTLQFDITQYEGVAGPTLPAPCNVRIRGMAPNARLAGLVVFNGEGEASTSNFVQAIEWAVLHDHVDVINESFGGNPYPDNDNDPISLANEAAVQVGTTVVVSTGDAGSAGTLGSPSTNQWVIAAGASTQYRLYAQMGYPAPLFTLKGYLNNNISALSSGGFGQSNARTVDVVAPGESGWALCSTNPMLYEDCTSFNGGATPIEDFGGTSEAAPLTSGEAALVIQAYRSTHGGASPSPALVKTIIMGTATDLGAPVTEQGAGLINALAAVNAALSIGSDRHGQSVLHYPTSASATDLPNTRQSRSFTVTNYGTSSVHLSPALQTLGAPIAGATLGLTLPATSGEQAVSFPNDEGATRSGVKQTFTVPSGADHLDVSISYQPSPTAAPIVFMALIDPNGRLAIYNLPQGENSGYSHVDIVSPVGGKWTAYVYSHTGDAESYTGPLVFTWAAERYVSFGSVSPSSLNLAPGASAVVNAWFSMPSQAGDSWAALRFGAAAGSIPVTLRTLVPVSSSGGSFSGTLTGGNGRPGAGNAQTFAFNVPSGAENLSLSLHTSDAGSPLEGLLVDPNGMQLSVQPNSNPSGATPSTSVQLFHYNPQPGQWRLVLVQNFSVSGNETSLPFTGKIAFYSNSQVVSGSLPNSPSVRVSASSPPAPIALEIRNNGSAIEWYFTDARLRVPTVVSLGTGQACATVTVNGGCEYTLVPPEASGVQFTAQSSTPITMDVYQDVGANVAGTGAPDLWALPAGKNTVAATLLVPEVPWGEWVLVPSLVGPYGSSGSSTTQAVSTSAVALMQPFDSTVSGSQGNLWADFVTGSNTFNPLTLAPGGTGTIYVTIAPSAAQVGTTVSGYLYLDTYNNETFTGDEVVRIPYSFTVTK